MISRCRWVSISILGSLFGAAAAPTARSAEPPPTAPYREPFAQSFPYRLEQHLQIKAYAERLPEKRANETPAEATPDFSNIAAYERSLQPWRQRIGSFYGTPPPGAKEGRVKTVLPVGEDADCTIYRVWIEVIDGVDAYGILMVPKRRTGKAPLIVAQHGGGGNPEAICDLDTRVNYRSFGREAVRRGYCVWAPALAMRSTYSGDPAIPGANREQLDAMLQRAGTSIIGLELYKIIESTRTLRRVRPEIDAERVGMTGLSWGGFFTMYATALSPFIKVAAPSGYFRDTELVQARARAGDAKAAEKELLGAPGHFQAVALIAPRPCRVEIGVQDEALNPMAGARAEVERAANFYRKLGIADRFEFSAHAGGHEFDTKGVLDFFAKHL